MGAKWEFGFCAKFAQFSRQNEHFYGSQNKQNKNNILLGEITIPINTICTNQVQYSHSWSHHVK